MTESLGRGQTNEVEWADFVYRHQVVGNMASSLITQELQEQVSSIDEGLITSLAQKASARLDRLNHRRQRVGLPKISTDQLIVDAMTKLNQDQSHRSASGVDQRVNLEGR